MDFIFLMISASLFLKPFDFSPDFFHHILTGKYILQNLSFPTYDIYTHTANGLPWVPYAWGGGTILYTIYNSFGEVGISVFVALIGLLTIHLLYKLTNSKIICLLITPLIALRFPDRPEIFTYPLLISTLLILFKKDKKYLYYLPLIIFLWANLYGSSVILGLGIIIFYFIYYRSNFTPLIISIIAAFINPYTYKSVFYILAIPQVATYEGEWANIFKILASYPPSFLITYQYHVLVYLIFLAIFIYVSFRNQRTIKDNLFIFLLSLSAFIPIFAFRQLPASAILTSIFLSKFIKPNKLTITIGIVLSFLVIYINYPFATKQNDSLVAMIDFIKTNKLAGNAFNHNNLGAYISYNLYPNIKIFYDTRDDLYLNTEAFFDLRKYYNENLDITPLLSKYKIDLIIADYVSDGLNYEKILGSKDWSVVFYSDRYFVALPSKIAKEKGLPIYSTPNYPTDKKSFINAYYFANTLIKSSKPKEAIEVLSTIKINNSIESPLLKKDLYYLYASAYLLQKDCYMAKKYLSLSNHQTKYKFIFNPLFRLPSNFSKFDIIYSSSCPN